MLYTFAVLMHMIGHRVHCNNNINNDNNEKNYNNKNNN